METIAILRIIEELNLAVAQMVLSSNSDVAASL